MSSSKSPAGPASQRQERYLRALADETGTTFVPPRSSGQASREIKRLLALKRNRGRHVELSQPTAPPVYGAAPHSSEMSGYGISAHWRTTRLPDAEELALHTRTEVR
jgi:hypothetical protein